MHKPRHDFDPDFVDAELDLVPMIDCIFLLLLFFMLCGRIATDQRNEMITTPPAKTAQKATDPNVPRVILNIETRGREDGRPVSTLRVNGHTITGLGGGDTSGYATLRHLLDTIHVTAEKTPDPRQPSLLLPKVILELRADADTAFRVVQEIQQVATDTVDPAAGLKPKRPGDSPGGRQERAALPGMQWE